MRANIQGHARRYVLAICYQYPGILDNGLIPVGQQSHEQLCRQCSMAESAKEGLIWSDKLFQPTYREVLLCGLEILLGWMSFMECFRQILELKLLE